ncbi:MAG: hypothetical protein ACD_68C00082G0001 [uncultured bacterium]|nr:MAG: hypothetical protein ACD_68C00082G0001 [uncultured bacterium]
MINYLDLTFLLNKKTPVYPGEPRLRLKTITKIAKEGYQQSQITLPTHIGTHLDAPSHIFKSGKKLTDFPVRSFVGDGVLIDARGESILSEKLVASREIKPNQIVLFYTNHSADFFKEDYFTSGPQMSPGLAEYLASRSVSMVGIDSYSLDYRPYPAHKILLKASVLIIENLTNLGSLLDNKEFTVIALPLKLAAEGSPCRVIAITT